MNYTYQLITGINGTVSTVKRMPGEAFVPFDPANTDYQEYLAWLAEGNTPDPAPEPPAE